MIDIDSINLKLIPESQLALLQIDNALAIHRENNTLKRALIIGLVLGGILIIYLLKNNDERKEN